MSLLLSLLLCVSTSFAFDGSAYTNAKNITPYFKIHWKTSSSDLFLALEVKNYSGWVGFGIGERTSGGMGGADFVVAEWNGTSLFITDRYGLGKYEPIVDNCSNWLLVRYETATDGTLFVELQRELNTFDGQDRAITSGETRILVAVGTTPRLSYHGSTRHASVVTFIPTNTTSVPVLSGNLVSLQLRMNATPPTEVTSYMCRAFSLPTDKDYHIVKFVPVIEAKNAKYVHHFLLYVCRYANTSGNFVNNYLNYSYGQSCNSPFGVDTGCQSLVHAWAVGAGEEYIPAEAGFRVGPGIDSIQYVLLETHYNNPGLDTGIIDNSGLDLVITDQLRQHDAAVMILGDVFADGLPLPGRTTTAQYQTDCPSACTSRWPNEIHVFASALHMHSYGSAIYTVLSRNGSRVGYTNRIEFWDYGLQQQTPMDLVLKPGDQLNTVCLFNTQSSANSVNFGPASSDEMCLNFLSYYPAIKSTSGQNYAFCGSIGFGFQFYQNGSATFLPSTPSTLCGSVLDMGDNLDGTGKMLSNPIVPLATIAQDNIITFGKPGDTCRPRPVPTTTPPPPLAASGRFLVVNALSIMVVFFLLLL